MFCASAGRRNELSSGRDSRDGRRCPGGVGSGVDFPSARFLDNRRGRDSVRWETKGKQHDKNNNTKIYLGCFPGRNNERDEESLCSALVEEIQQEQKY